MTPIFSSCMALMFTGSHLTKYTLANGRSRQGYIFISFGGEGGGGGGGLVVTDVQELAAGATVCNVLCFHVQLSPP